MPCRERLALISVPNADDLGVAQFLARMGKVLAYGVNQELFSLGVNCHENGGIASPAI